MEQESNAQPGSYEPQISLAELQEALNDGTMTRELDEATGFDVDLAV